jgi:catechol 2,3-dioxygenase-like lactoylglutathione lyase family enzyme
MKGRMMDDPKEKIFDPAQLCQIGIVVKSIDETLKYYKEKFGMGPFEIRQVDYPTASYYGKEEGYRGKRAFFHSGPIQIELIELVDGKTIHESFLREKGEGVHHVGFRVADLDRAMELARSQGFQITQHFRREDGSGFAYLDSDKTGGVIFEMILYPTPK